MKEEKSLTLGEMNNKRDKMDNSIYEFKKVLGMKQLQLKEYKEVLNNINNQINMYFNKDIILNKILNKMNIIDINEIIPNNSNKPLYSILIDSKDSIINIEGLSLFNNLELDYICKFIRKIISDIIHGKEFFYDLQYLNLKTSNIKIDIEGYIIKISIMFLFEENSIPYIMLNSYSKNLEIVKENLIEEMNKNGIDTNIER